MNIPFPVVWSDTGPVSNESVGPVWRVQSIVSVLSWVQVQMLLLSKLQSWEEVAENNLLKFLTTSVVNVCCACVNNVLC